MASQKIVGPQGIVELNKFSDRQGIQDYKLPSRGIIYRDSEGNVLFPDGVIQISPMTVAEEKLLASNAASSGSKKLGLLIDRCCDLKSMLAQDLIVHDVHALLYAIRSLSYGNFYPFDYECPSCSSKSRQSLDIDAHPITYAPDNFKDITEIDLPVSKVSVEVRRFRLRDDSGKSKDSGTSAFDMLAKAIVSIDGKKVSHTDSEMWLNRLLVRDRAAITNSMNDNVEELGLSSTTDVTCSSCGHVNEGVAVPFGEDFFRVEE